MEYQMQTRRKTNRDEQNPRKNMRKKSGGRQVRNRMEKIGPIRFNGKTVPHFFQGDTRWAKRLLNDDDTISSAGCAVSTCACVGAFFGRNVTPADVDKVLDQNNGYISGSDGIANWDIALSAGERPDLKIRLERSVRLYEDDTEEEMLELIEESLRQNVPVIGRVKYGNSTKKYDHFLCVVGKSRKGRHLLVDPGLPQGDGPSDPKQADVVLETATRKGGLQLVGIQQLKVITN